MSDSPTWRAPETLTLDQARAASAQLRQAQAAQPSGQSVVVDASALRVFDSAALALLLQARRDAGAVGAGFELHGASAQLQQLAWLYGVAELLGVPARV